MIEIEQARGLLARAVLTQPDGFCYIDRRFTGQAGCRYVPMSVEELVDWFKLLPFDTSDVDVTTDPRHKTGCLIGTALVLAGETRHLEPEYATTSIAAIADSVGDMMTAEVSSYFQVAQWAQDNGRSWRDAYGEAEMHYVLAQSGEE